MVACPNWEQTGPKQPPPCLFLELTDRALSAVNSDEMVFKNQDAWRNHKLFQGLWKDPFPGLRTAAIIYGVYLGLEFGYKTVMGPSKSHESHH